MAIVYRLAEDAVFDHPQHPWFSVVMVGGHTVVVSKVGVPPVPAYKTGDLVVFVPVGSILPMNLAQVHTGGNCVIEPCIVDGIVSEGVLLPVEHGWSLHVGSFEVACAPDPKLPPIIQKKHIYLETYALSEGAPEMHGRDVSDILGIRRI